MFSRIKLARFSSASEIRGNAVFESTYIVTPNRSSVQSMSPSPGETRKLPPSSSVCPASSACASRKSPMSPSTSITGLEEERDEAEDERVERDGLGQRETEPADRLQLVPHLGLASDRFDLLAEDDADADA